MANDVKVLRGQVRQIVKELLEEELIKAVEERLTKILEKRLALIDKKQKDIAGFMVRNNQLGVK
jgi:DNA topoisomerase IA